MPDGVRAWFEGIKGRRGWWRRDRWRRASASCRDPCLRDMDWAAARLGVGGLRRLGREVVGGVAGRQPGGFFRCRKVVGVAPWWSWSLESLVWRARHGARDAVRDHALLVWIDR